jgi:hypothetical protein
MTAAARAMIEPTRVSPLRHQIVAVAAELTTCLGWSAATAPLADIVGVSRQIVHHETGSKPVPAEALVTGELARPQSGRTR